MAVESVNYDCANCGYYVYESVWEPREKQVLSCLHEENDIYDMFAIKTCLTDENGKEQLVRQPPLEFSGFPNCLLNRGNLTSTHYRISVLVQGGLEIPC